MRFSGRIWKFKRFFRSKTGVLQKRSSSQKRHKIWYQSTKNTNLDLDLRSRSPESVNFFGAQSSLGRLNFCLGGHKQSVGGGTAPVCPPWRRVRIKPFIILAVMQPKRVTSMRGSISSSLRQGNTPPFGVMSQRVTSLLKKCGGGGTT